MKSRTLTLITAMTLLAVLASPLRLAAQEIRNQPRSPLIASASAQGVLPSARALHTASASPMTLAQAPVLLRAAVRATLGRLNTPSGATQQAELTASDGAPNDRFGISVAIYGSTAVVGAYDKNSTGAVYVFVRSGTTWTQQAELTASDGAAGDEFGFSVAISGSTAVVGADGKNSFTGAAYVFVRSGTTWTQQAELTASDGVSEDELGLSVAISGSTAVVGALGKNKLTGAAYVFVRSGTTWTQQAELTASDGVSGDALGSSVAFSGSTAVVGADGKNSFTGAAYVFVRSGTTWAQQAELTASDGAPQDALGYSVAFSGSAAVVGAPGKKSQTGAAYVFVRSGTTWTQQAELTASDGAAFFGLSVAISGSVAVVGGYGKNNFTGAAYVFERSGTAWTQQAELTASDGVSGDAFGSSVAFSGSTAVVGAPGKNSQTGAAYVFVLPPKLTTLHSFNSTDGATPYAGLVQATNGDLYGTTSAGGAFNNGTVFKITPSGALTTVYSFCSQSGCPDGANPYAGLVQASNGNFYGTTYGGGAFNSGTVFKITPGGTLTTLYSFCSLSNCDDGAGPNHALVQASNGNLYGTTNGGGDNSIGTVFKITLSGTLTTLYTFGSANNDGSSPQGDLVQATNGNLYGTTHLGGDNDGGTVFKITPRGTLTTLYRFCSQSSCPDGRGPDAGLVQGADGNFYGTTFSGGANFYGTVFKITPSGKLTTLHSFDTTDGAGPEAALIQATDGDLYGTTISFGVNGNGTIFKITPSGTLTTLYNFCSQSGCLDGAFPQAALLQDTNGTFYGTTPSGGASNDGTVFSLSVGLDAFVETQPASGRVGAAVRILGTDLTGATSVTFNGTTAVFNVASSSLITTSVPTGATTGFVEVTTPLGTFDSNRKFLVRP